MKIELIAAQPVHAELMLRWRNEANTLAYNPVAPITIDELRERLRLNHHDLSMLEADAVYRWMVRADGELVANVSLKGADLSMGLAEIGYSVGEKYQGRGIATAAVSELVEQIFSQTPLRKLLAYVHVDNLSSCRVLEKLGFKREGLLRQHYVIGGKPADEALYGLLRSEWR